MPILQRLVDGAAFQPDQKYELQCLGVCFGDALCGPGAFRWTVVEDEYGRDPALQWKDTTIKIFVLTMISKRVERGEPVNVEWLARTAFERVRELEKDRP